MLYSLDSNMEDARVVVPRRVRKPLKTASGSAATENVVLECRFCQRSFNKPYNLLIHERTHLKGLEGGSGFGCGGPVPCDICGKVFRKVESMKNHRVSHSPPSVPKELKGFLGECVTY